MAEALVHIGMKSVVPVPVTALDGGAVLCPVLESLVDTEASPFGGAVNTKAEGGNPPIVAASPAFSAYGTLNSNTSGCSACSAIRTPSQRASPVVNNVVGTPLGFVMPSCTE